MNKHLFRGIGAVALLLSLVGCTVDQPLPGGGGSGFGSIHVSSGLPKVTTGRTSDFADVARVEVTVSWAGGQSPTVDMTRVGEFGFELNILALPLGQPLTIACRAKSSSGEVLFFGEVSGVVLAEGVPADVVVDLLATDDGENSGMAPRVVEVRKPILPVRVGEIVAIEFDVADRNDATVTYSLTTSAGGVGTASGSIPLKMGRGSLATTFTAPQTAGVATLSLALEDVEGLRTTHQTNIIAYQPPPSPPYGEIETGVNFAPVIHGVNIAPAGSPGQLALTAVVTDDQAFGGLQYFWTSSSLPPGTGNPLIVASEQGVLPFELTVVDAFGAATSIKFTADTDSAVVEDLPTANQPPVVVGAVLSNQDVSFGDVVTATVFALDPEGSPLTANWTTSLGTILTQELIQSAGGQPAVARATWTGPVVAGNSQLTLRLSDPSNANVQFSFEIRQILGQVPLTAAAGPDQDLFLGQTAQLNGSASASGDGQILTYQWTQMSGPASTIATPTLSQTSVSFTAAGTYVYKLQVANINNTAFDTVQIVVTDPLAFAFVDADVDNTGMAYFLDTAAKRVRRYNLVDQAWRSPMPLGDAPRVFAVAPEGDSVYVGYDGGRVDVIPTTTGVRTLFVNNPATVTRMYVVGGYLYVQDPTGAWATRSLYNRQTGVRTYTAEWTYTSNGFQYSPTMNRLFHFRDGTSPNDILYSDVNQSNGTMSAVVDSPYHGGYTFSHPLRLFPDQTRIVVASGVIFSTTNLAVVGGLGTSYTDLRFSDGRPVLIRPSGSQTELAYLNDNFTVAFNQLLPGAPLKVFTLGGNAFVVSQNGSTAIRLNVVPLPE